MVKKKKKTKPDAAELMKRQQINLIRSIFRLSGFKRDPKAADKEFEFKDQKSDFDDYFVYENVLLCFEYTTSKKASDHLKTKKIVYDLIDGDEEAFVTYICDKFETIKDALLVNYLPEQVIVKIVYCPRNDLAQKYRDKISYPKYLDFHSARYFQSLVKSIKYSARFEIFDLLSIDESSVGRDGVIAPSIKRHYSGMLLPASSSGYGLGVKVVSFYACAQDLLEQAYVFRKSGWKDKTGGYQRLLKPAKLTGLRQHIKHKRSVFPTNVVVSLPSSTRFCDEDGNDIEMKDYTQISPVEIEYEKSANSIGLIDGQHRVYSYHETQDDDPTIKMERSKRNLLVTGFVFPKSWPQAKRSVFEAELFLEVNGEQTSVPSDVKLFVKLFSDPFNVTSIATRVLFEMNSKNGPLEGLFQQFFYEKDKLKTSSIISYAIVPLVRPKEENLFFANWTNPDKNKMVDDEDHILLAQYIEYCIDCINNLVSAFKENTSKAKWTTDKKVDGYFLNTTRINAMIILLRLIVESGKVLSREDYVKKLKGYDKIDFTEFKSSQYRKMAEKIFEEKF